MDEIEQFHEIYRKEHDFSWNNLQEDLSSPELVSIDLTSSIRRLKRLLHIGPADQIQLLRYSFYSKILFNLIILLIICLVIAFTLSYTIFSPNSIGYYICRIYYPSFSALVLISSTGWYSYCLINTKKFNSKYKNIEYE